MNFQLIYSAFFTCYYRIFGEKIKRKIKEIVENIQRISKIVPKFRKLSKNIEFCFPRHSFYSIWKFKAQSAYHPNTCNGSSE